MKRHKCTKCRKKRLEKFLKPIRESDKPNSMTWICIDGCQYGDHLQKPTDLWNNITPWIPRPMCKPGADCHESSPRGNKTSGTQSLNDSIERSRIPPDLCREILKVCESNI